MSSASLINVMEPGAKDCSREMICAIKQANGGISLTILKFLLNNQAKRESFGHASRSLRLAVPKRKVSVGSRSMERFQHTANLLTVVQTCRRQARSVIDFFAQALIANSNNSLSRPSLLPQY